MTMAHEKQGYIGDLSKKTRTELLELLSRQEKLIANRQFISRLPDKGKKICCFKAQLEQLLEEKEDNVTAVAEELAKLRVSRRPAPQVLDSDDDEEEILNKNPTVWETLAANGPPTKTVSLPSASVLDTPMPALESSDIMEDAVGNETGFYTGLATVMDNKIPQPVKQRLKLNRPQSKLESTKPSKTQSCHNANQPEEESAVRYPMGPHLEVKVLPITESLQLQADHMLQMKELQVKQAVERLAQKMNIAIGEYEPEAASKMNYRDVPQVNGESEDEAYEEIDET